MRREELLIELLKYFLAENKEMQIGSIPFDYMERRKLLRALMNIREPEPIDSNILKLQDELLLEELKGKSIVNPYNLSTVAEDFKSMKIPFSEKLVLWRGDITTIEADSIVNAANSKMLGCFVPLHK